MIKGGSMLLLAAQARAEKNPCASSFLVHLEQWNFASKHENRGPLFCSLHKSSPSSVLQQCTNNPLQIKQQTICSNISATLKKNEHHNNVRIVSSHTVRSNRTKVKDLLITFQTQTRNKRNLAMTRDPCPQRKLAL